MIDTIIIENFKSYKKQSLPLAPLTLLIGANASGKSNAIEAFRFLSWLAEGLKLSTLQNEINKNDRFIRGNINELFYPNQSEFGLEAVLSKEGLNYTNFNITISLREYESTKELHISKESIYEANSPTQPLYSIKVPSSGYSTDVQVAYNNFSRGQNKPTVTCTDQIAILNQLVSPAPFRKKDSQSQVEIPKTTKKFQEILSKVIFLDTIPARMRLDSYPSHKLESDGSNLAGVLYTLCEDLHKKNILLEFIQSLPEQNILNINFEKDKRGQVYFELIEKFANETKNWSAELLSDGTLRVISIAAALLSVAEGSVVVIEEIDNGIHPSRAKHLINTITNQAKERNLRLLLSTHNPALMDALPNEALGDVVFCYRDKEQGDSCLVRLSDLPRYPELLVQGSLGDLVTQGILDKFVKSPISEEERKQKALAWIDEVMGDDNE